MVHFSSVTLSPSALLVRVDISKHLLVQSAANLDERLQADMSNAIANAFDKHIIDDIYVWRPLLHSKLAPKEQVQNIRSNATDFAEM